MLLIDCWAWISLAIFEGLVSILLYLSIIQSSGGASRLLKNFLCICFGFFSYICLYLDISFITQSLVYFVIIVQAWVFVVLAIVANAMSHSCSMCSWMGNCGMLVCL